MHQRGVRHDLDDVDVEIEVGVGADRAAGGRALAIGELARDMDLVAAALLHLLQRFGEAGDDLPTGIIGADRRGRRWCRTPCRRRAAFIFDQHAVDRPIERASPALTVSTDAAGGLAGAPAEASEQRRRRSPAGCQATAWQRAALEGRRWVTADMATLADMESTRKAGQSTG